MPLLLVRESGDTADAVDLSEWCWSGAAGQQCLRPTSAIAAVYTG